MSVVRFTVPHLSFPSVDTPRLLQAPVPPSRIPRGLSRVRHGLIRNGAWVTPIDPSIGATAAWPWET